MSRCVVISAGPFHDPQVLSGMLMPDDYIIIADGGWRLAQQMGVVPSVVVADFDSLPQQEIDSDVKVISLPVEKDDTDTAIAIKHGFGSGYREFLLLGCTGGRLDHQQAALITAADYARQGCSVVIADERNEIHLLMPGEYSFAVRPDEKVSFFAFGGEVTGLFADGLQYDITNMTLSPYDPLCVSNACLEEDFGVIFKSGLLLIYFSKD